MALRDTILTSIHGRLLGLNHEGELVSRGGFAIKEEGAQELYKAEFDADGYLLAVPYAHAQVYSTQNQVPANTNELQVTFNEIEDSSNITTSSNEFVIQHRGFYVLLAGAQVGKVTGANLRNLDLWIKKNGTNVAGSMVRGGITNNDTTVVILNIGLSLDVGDVITVWQEVDSTDGGIGLYTFVGDDAPNAPSIIFTMYRT